MALDGTHAGLVASVGNWLNRADLSSYVPDWIRAAEAQIARRLVKEGGVRQMYARVDATINAEFCSVPTDFRGAKTLWVNGANTASGLLKLKYTDPDQINEMKAYHSTAGSPCPTHFTVVGKSFQFWPWNGVTEAGSFSAELTYLQAIPPLAQNDNNWLITDHPDIYLYTALVQSAPFLKNDARLQTWANLATTFVQDLIDADKIERTSAEIAVPYRPAGYTP